jgi:hypothetical protein
VSIEINRCPAHGDARCTDCARISAEYLIDGQACRSCDYFAATGMHWDTCPGRIRGPITTSRQAMTAHPDAEPAPVPARVLLPAPERTSADLSVGRWRESSGVAVVLYDTDTGQCMPIEVGAVPLRPDAPGDATTVIQVLRDMADLIDTRKTFQNIVTDLEGLA